MFNRFILIFFYFFLLSRFFSEKIKILPKYVDVINYPLFFILLILLIINLNKKSIQDLGENSFILKSVIIFSLFFALSIIFNNNRILFLASVLFYIGFMEGPLLFLCLNKITKNSKYLIKEVNRYFLLILVINLGVIFIIDIPQFLLSSNPDVISGTYGNNTYQFSMLLLICGGYLLGYNYIKKSKTIIVIASQLVIFAVFYLSQFRAGLPFFIIAYVFMIGMLYGKNVIIRLLPITIISVLIFLSLFLITKKEKAVEDLKFEDWIEIVSEPGKFLSYGKFQIYINVLDMYKEFPQTFILGTGPGNFLSRANYSFSYELLVSSKGVSNIISDVFGIKYPYFSDLHKYYVMNRIRSEAIFGTWQLSNPYSSYLSGISEIGIIGGLSIIIMYIFIIFKSLIYIKLLKNKNPLYIPLSISLVGSAIYLFSLAFLENYWEQARVTLPVWLLFWAVKTAVYNFDKKDSDNNN